MQQTPKVSMESLELESKKIMINNLQLAPKVAAVPSFEHSEKRATEKGHAHSSLGSSWD